MGRRVHSTFPNPNRTEISVPISGVILQLRPGLAIHQQGLAILQKQGLAIQQKEGLAILPGLASQTTIAATPSIKFQIAQFQSCGDPDNNNA